jgi:hypothetical protein
MLWCIAAIALLRCTDAPSPVRDKLIPATADRKKGEKPRHAEREAGLVVTAD